MTNIFPTVFLIVIYVTILWIQFNVFIYCEQMNNIDCFEDTIILVIISSLLWMDSTTDHIGVIINHIVYCQSNYHHIIPLYNVILPLLIAITVVLRTIDTIACNLFIFIIVTSLQPCPNEATHHVSSQQQPRLENGFFFAFYSFFYSFFDTFRLESISTITYIFTSIQAITKIQSSGSIYIISSTSWCNWKVCITNCMFVIDLFSYCINIIVS